MRIACGVEYCGAAYRGWQRQRDNGNIQGAIEQALSSVADTSIEIVCAGRTDTGVHALGQVIHFDTDVLRDTRAWVLGTNTHLPNDIRLTWAQQLNDGFHARFSAIARRYIYVLHNGLTRPGVFHAHQAWHYPSLDVEVMHQAAQALLGEHDFSSFRGVDCQAKSPNRCIESITVTRQADAIFFEIKANAFLYHMVRNIVGSLLPIGSGDKASEWLVEVLAAKDRRQAGITAPAQGLYFMQAYYPHEICLPSVTPLFFCEKNAL